MYRNRLRHVKVVVEEPSVAATVALGNTEFYAGKDNDLKLEVTDSNGNAITEYNALKAAKIVVKDTFGGTIKLNKNSDGTGSYVWTIPDTVAAPKDDKHKNTEYGTLTVYANAATSGNYVVKSFNVIVKEKPIEWEITGTTTKTITSAASGSVLGVDLSTLTYADQYGNAVEFKNVSAATIQYLVVSNGGVVEEMTTGGNATKVDAVTTGSTLTPKKVITVSTGAVKGTAKLYLRILNDTNKTKPLSSDYNDLALDLNVVDGKSVDETAEVQIASINDGRDVYAATPGSITFVGSLSAGSVGSGSAVYGTAVPVVVTAKVGSKTIVVDPSQYTITNPTVDGLKEVDTVTNPAVSVTKTLRVVVNTSTNETVVVTKDYTLSNAKSVVKSIESTDAATVTTSSALTVDGTDISGSIKAIDQYGEDVVSAVSNSIIYYVFPTGADADKVHITNNNSAQISITFDAAGTYYADVTYTKGDATYTKKGVKFTI